MAGTDLRGLGAHGFYVQTDHFSICAVVVIAENLNLVKRGTQAFSAKGFVLIITAAVLIVEMYGAQFAEF